MTSYNAANERMKRHYFAYLADALGHSEQTIDAVAKAIARFEAYTRYKDFKTFHIEQAKAFKRDLTEQRGSRSGEPLSKATLYATLTALKRFFIWLAGQPGYKSRISYADAEYFNLSAKDTRIAKATRPVRVPTLEQIRHVIQSMPASTDTGRRARALIAFTILTGARDGAIASFKLRHVDIDEGLVDQDWPNGYYSGTRHNTVVDVSALKSHARDMMDYCVEHRDMTLMDVIQNALGAEK
jgi:integrase